MELAYAYRRLIDSLVASSGSAALLHVHAGLAIYLGVQLVVRTRRGSMLALHAVFAAEMANELLDWLAPSPKWGWGDTIWDIAATMMWPVAITLVSQHRRARWRRTLERPTPGAGVARAA